MSDSRILIDSLREAINTSGDSKFRVMVDYKFKTVRTLDEMTGSEVVRDLLVGINPNPKGREEFPVIFGTIGRLNKTTTTKGFRPLSVSHNVDLFDRIAEELSNPNIGEHKVGVIVDGNKSYRFYIDKDLKIINIVRINYALFIENFYKVRVSDTAFSIKLGNAEISSDDVRDLVNVESVKLAKSYVKVCKQINTRFLKKRIPAVNSIRIMKDCCNYVTPLFESNTEVFLNPFTQCANNVEFFKGSLMNTIMEQSKQELSLGDSRVLTVYLLTYLEICESFGFSRFIKIPENAILEVLLGFIYPSDFTNVGQDYYYIDNMKDPRNVYTRRQAIESSIPDDAFIGASGAEIIVNRYYNNPNKQAMNVLLEEFARAQLQ